VAKFSERKDTVLTTSIELAICEPKNDTKKYAKEHSN